MAIQSVVHFPSAQRVADEQIDFADRNAQPESPIRTEGGEQISLIAQAILELSDQQGGNALCFEASWQNRIPDADLAVHAHDHAHVSRRQMLCV